MTLKSDSYTLSLCFQYIFFKQLIVSIQLCKSDKLNNLEWAMGII